MCVCVFVWRGVCVIPISVHEDAMVRAKSICTPKTQPSFLKTFIHWKQDFFEEFADFKAEEEKVEDEPRIFCVSKSEGVLKNDEDLSKARLKDFYWTSQG